MAVVCILCGFWHGANWTFIVWGLYYFVLLSIEKLSGYSKTVEKPGWAFYGHAYMILTALFGWVLFRSDNISYAMYYYRAMFKLNQNQLYDAVTHLYISENLVYLICAALFSIPVVKWLKNRLQHPDFILKKDRLKPILSGNKIPALFACTYPVLMTFLLILCISYIVAGTHNPFIYFNF